MGIFRRLGVIAVLPSVGETMPKVDATQRVRKLLEAIRADFPRLKAAAEELMQQRYGLDSTLELAVSPPEKFRFIPTFDPNRRR